MNYALHPIYDAWLAAYADDVARLGLPDCVVCGKPLRLGSLIDGLWPYHMANSHHRACHAAFMRMLAQEADE